MDTLKFYLVMCVDHDSNEKVVLQTYTDESQAQAYIANQFEKDQNNGFVNACEYFIETETMYLSDKFDSDMAKVFGSAS